MDKCVIEGGKDMRHSKNLFTFTGLKLQKQSLDKSNYT